MRVARLITCALGSLLSACGNAYERVYLEKWAPTGTVGTPIDPHVVRTKFRLEALEPGQGAPIELGSLVHARVRGSLERADYRGHRSRTDDEVWFWIGNGEPYAKDRPTIHLGSGVLRAAMIGARVGSRLSLVFDSGQAGAELHLPRKGFLLDYTADVYFGTGADRDYAALSAWRDHEIAILAVCPGRLLRRQGVMKQWGYVFDIWARRSRHSFAREGPLVWGAIEGDCGSAKKRVRMEKGPALHPYSGTFSGSWPHSYERAVRLGRVSEQ